MAKHIPCWETYDHTTKMPYFFLIILYLILFCQVFPEENNANIFACLKPFSSLYLLTGISMRKYHQTSHNTDIVLLQTQVDILAVVTSRQEVVEIPFSTCLFSLCWNFNLGEKDQSSDLPSCLILYILIKIALHIVLHMSSKITHSHKHKPLGQA